MKATKWISALALLAATPAFAVGVLDQVDPIDQENLGLFQVVTPDQSRLPLPLTPLSMTYGGNALAPSTPLRLTAGPRCLTLIASSVATPYRLERCDLAVVKKQLTTYALSGLVVKWDASKTDVDFGPTVTFQVSHNDNVIKSAQQAWPAVPTQVLPLTDGKVRIDQSPDWHFPGLDSFSLQLAQGEVQTVDLTPKNEIRGAVEVQFDKADFPDAGENCHKAGAFMIWRDAGHEADIARDGIFEPFPTDVTSSVLGASSRYGIAQFRRMGRSELKAMRAIPFPDASHRYEFVVNNMLMPVELRRDTTTVIKLKRIDINDVKVTQEDGVVYYAPGIYSVYRKNEANPATWELIHLPAGQRYASEVELEGYHPPHNGHHHHYPSHPSYPSQPSQPSYPTACGLAPGGFITEFPTKTGLDVPSGSYKVVVKYQTKEGPRSQEFLVNLVD